MLGYLIRRLSWAVVLFLIVTLYTYVLFFILPGNNQTVRRGFRQAQTPSTLRDNTLGVENQSLVREYGSFVWAIVHLDLGTSRVTREPVASVIGRAAPVTMSLVLGGAVVWLLLAFPIGILSALRPRSLLDRAGMVFVLIGVSAHPLWIGLILSYIFGFQLAATPIAGYCSIFTPTETCGGPVQWAYHLLLPWFAFGFVFAAIYARMIRANVIETFDSEHVRTARAVGMGEWRILKTQVLRNALLPIVTMVGMDVGIAFSGAIFVERAFNLPGIGPLLFGALQRRDLPVILGIVVLVTTAILVFNLIVDLLYPLLDPRVWHAGMSSGLAPRRVKAAPAPESTPVTAP
ncbi:MAG TPA: ABC transporter permease [Gaiellaceae bacterium]|nr:ABC transporter permease [Gaiellaceae bacterium]